MKARVRARRRRSLLLMLLAVPFLVCLVPGSTLPEGAGPDPAALALGRSPVVAAEPAQGADFEFDYAAAQASAQKNAEEEALAEQQRAAWESAAERVAELGRGTRTAVVVIDLDTGERMLSYHAAERFVPASVYKLPIVFSILSKVEKGELDEGASSAGMSVSQCLESAIVRSENECSEAWIDQLGLEGAEREAARAGMHHTTFSPYQLRTTANDVSSFLVNLYDGRLLNEKNTRRMIELMKRQVWRDGMPSVFEPEYVVADKVGFLSGVRTDAGIVYTDRADYAVVILTEADDWPFVAAVSEPIADALNAGVTSPE